MFNITQQQWLTRSITLLLLVLMMYPLTASAHLIPAQQGTLNIVKDRVYVVLSIPVSAFPELDTNNDGSVSNTELQQQKNNIISLLQSTIHIGDEQAKPLDGILLDMSPAHDSEESAQLVIMGIVKLHKTPNELDFSMTLFGTHENEQAYKITATREDQVIGSNSSKAVITNSINQTVFFSSPLTTLSKYISLGIKHILLGADHVIFLLILFALGLSVRRWLGLLTCFTLAHACTFTVTSLGFIAIPVAFIEPLIAMTIICLACVQLYGAKLSLRIESLIIFCCGLLHGLGFSLTLGQFTMDNSYPLWSILGFNLGIEIGQIIVAAFMGLLLLIWKHSGTIKKQAFMPKTIALYSLLLRSF